MADLAAARVFYEALFGREADLVPNDTELCWRLGDAGDVAWLCVVVDPVRAGGAISTVLIDDLDAWVAECAARGVAPVEIRREGDAGRKARFVDPDGNELGFAQVG
ncbi:VOC family protein [Baekduia alba]|uniref:VOC family protein n=1 Tax=Baekduia alba TaxID=2997333 RepID=UPI0023417DDD|nr:VOC family protein [Baekduia alba]